MKKLLLLAVVLLTLMVGSASASSFDGYNDGPGQGGYVCSWATHWPNPWAIWVRNSWNPSRDLLAYCSNPRWPSWCYHWEYIAEAPHSPYTTVWSSQIWPTYC